MFASPAFDASLWEMGPVLLAGGCLAPVPDAARGDADALCAFLTDARISNAYLPPTLCEELCLTHGGALSHLRIQTGGDVLGGIGDGSIRVTNNYGPTECTVLVTSCAANGNEPPFPIGTPIANTEILILDRAGNMQPRGVPGEICVGGISLARGYWTDSEKTNAAFVPHPIRTGERIYRTGDRGRWRADGQLAFLGRYDDQVKVRGYRIEPGEVESILRQRDGIRDAGVVVATSSGGENMLVGFVVPEGEALDDEAIRSWMARHLPAYMIPSRIVQAEDLPRTLNGKLDRDALLAQMGSLSAAAEYRAPETETEIALAAVWCEVLGVERVGADDHFFELGGHSLTATRVLSQIRGRLATELPLKALFEHPTLAALARAVDAHRATDTAGPASGPTPIPRANRRAFRAPKENPDG